MQAGGWLIFLLFWWSFLLLIIRLLLFQLLYLLSYSVLILLPVYRVLDLDLELFSWWIPSHWPLWLRDPPLMIESHYSFLSQEAISNTPQYMRMKIFMSYLYLTLHFFSYYIWRMMMSLLISWIISTYILGLGYSNLSMGLNFTKNSKLYTCSKTLAYRDNATGALNIPAHPHGHSFRLFSWGALSVPRKNCLLPLVMAETIACPKNNITIVLTSQKKDLKLPKTKITYKIQVHLLMCGEYHKLPRIN